MLYTSLYVYFFLPAFLFGSLLKKTRAFFAILALGGLIISAAGLAMTSSATGLAGLVVIIPALFLPICAGVIAGALLRSGISYFNFSETPIKYYASLTAPLFIPLVVVLTFDYKFYTKTKTIEDAGIAEGERLWMTDVTFEMQDHTLTLPYAARLSLQFLNDDNMTAPEKIHKQVYSFSIGGPQQSECYYRLNQKCISAKKRVNNEWKRWCKLRPDMSDTFWCADELNVLRIYYTNISAAQFDQRKIWLENPNSERLPPLNYRGKDKKLVIHENWGLDRRGEAIFSVCGIRECTLDYAIEADILLQISYNLEEDAILDELLQKYINTAEARWKSWQVKLDG